MTSSSQPDCHQTERPGRWAAAGRLLCPLVLVVATFAAYLQVRNHEFLSYDDPGYVMANPYLRLGERDPRAGRALSQAAGLRRDSRSKRQR